MKTLIHVVLLLAPFQPLQAALLSDSENCCVITNHANALNNLGSQLYAAGNYAKAEKTLRQALEMEQVEAHPNPDLLASTINNLAAAVRMQSRLPEAQELYQRAIAMRESHSPELARPLAGLAMVYGSEGRLPQAIELAERAIRVSGTRPDDVRLMAIANNSLATLLMARGDSARAAALEQHVIDELQRTAGTATEEYVNALTNLGTSSLRQFNYPQAELQLRAAEAAALKVAGPEHPVISIIRNNLARVEEARGDLRNAEILYEEAIGVWRKTLGPTHPDVAYGLKNLAALNQRRKRYAEAERLYREALEIDQAALGAGSLRVANDWNNLGGLSAATHHYREAERLVQKALTLALQTAGSDHPDTASIEVNLAVVYLSQRRFEEASALFAKALPVKEQVLGRDSPELASILRLYASSQKASGNYVAAERAELQATRITTHNALIAQAR